jgi:energy-coupling factor transporter ATP-binding protein EcfA2
VAHHPAVLFLDEPTAGVDPASRRVFWNLIHDLAEGGTTVVVTTHYLDEAEYCDQIVMMHAGGIVASGGPGDLKERVIPGVVLELEGERSDGTDHPNSPAKRGFLKPPCLETPCMFRFKTGSAPKKPFAGLRPRHPISDSLKSISNRSFLLWKMCSFASWRKHESCSDSHH